MKVNVRTRVEKTEEREIDLPAYFTNYDSIEGSWWESEARVLETGETCTLTKRGDGSRTIDWELELRRYDVGDALGSFLINSDYRPSTKEAFDAARVEFHKILDAQ